MRYVNATSSRSIEVAWEEPEADVTNYIVYCFVTGDDVTFRAEAVVRMWVFNCRSCVCQERSRCRK